MTWFRQNHFCCLRFVRHERLVSLSKHGIDFDDLDVRIRLLNSNARIGYTWQLSIDQSGIHLVDHESYDKVFEDDAVSFDFDER